MVYLVVGLLLVVGLVVWMIVGTIRYEKAKRGEGKETADATLAAQDERTMESFGRVISRHPILSHVISGLIFGGAGCWLSKVTWEDLTSLESGRIDSVSLWKGVGFLYEHFGVTAAKLFFPLVTALYLGWWLFGLVRRLSAKPGAKGGS